MRTSSPSAFSGLSARRLASFTLVTVGTALAIACGSSGGVDEEAQPSAAPSVDAGTKKADASKSSAQDAAADDDDDNGEAKDAAAKKDGGDASAFVWPDCKSKPATAQTRSIEATWQANPTTASETWIHDAYVVGISGGACVANKACQVFLQEGTGYASLAAAAHHGIKLFVSAATAFHFTSLKIGDQVDALGWAWRYNLDGQNELLLQVNAQLPGCALTTSSQHTLTPVPDVALADLTVSAYENTHGPVFVEAQLVSGRPTAVSSETFGLWETGGNGAFGDAGGTNIVSLSPFFLPGGAFSGLTATKITAFTRVVGVFGLFIPSGQTGTVQKFLEIYPRTTADIVPK